ncbi:hypothetical protein ACFS07_30180 [Undibacterium arcticum]
MRKVNIDTDIRLAMTGAMRRSMAQHPSEFDPRKFFSRMPRLQPRKYAKCALKRSAQPGRRRRSRLHHWNGWRITTRKVNWTLLCIKATLI